MNTFVSQNGIRMPFAIVCVTNDLTTDQRVDRTCGTLVRAGYVVLLVGRKLKTSKPLEPRKYGMHRMPLLFTKGALFYAEYNLTLFFFLLFRHFDLVVSNDLDTLPAAYYARLFKGKRSNIRHLHDCHEYFRGVPELVGRRVVTAIWKWIEDRIFPKLTMVTAVNGSIARLYTQEYGNEITVIRNVPYRKEVPSAMTEAPDEVMPRQKIILYQGAVNVDRGLEEAILAMKFLVTDAILVIAGTGDIIQQLREFTRKEGLDTKIIFLGQVPFSALHAITVKADVGLSIEKNIGLNYYYCLPNKLLDYIQARVPVLVSPFPEMKTIVENYEIGEFIASHEPPELAAKLDSMLNNPTALDRYRRNLEKAAEELCWEREEARLFNLININPNHHGKH